MAVPFSKAIETNGFVFFSGQIHIDENVKLVGETIEEKTRICMDNVGKRLEEVGLDFSDVVSSTVYLSDFNDYQAVSEVYGTYFSEPYPVRTMIGVSDLPFGASVEVTIIAVRKE